jgi:hypothetical protein
LLKGAEEKDIPLQLPRVLLILQLPPGNCPIPPLSSILPPFWASGLFSSSHWFIFYFIYFPAFHNKQGLLVV